MVSENEPIMKELKDKMESLDAAKPEYNEVRKKYKKIEREVDAAKETLRKMDRDKKWHVGNMCHGPCPYPCPCPCHYVSFSNFDASPPPIPLLCGYLH